MLNIQWKTGLTRLREALYEADAVLIGAGAGLSTAAGFDYGRERFKANFSDFEKKYGFHDMYSGGFYPYQTLEEFWAFWSRQIILNRYVDPPKPVYHELFQLVRDKDYFVLTTNVDHCFQKAGFDKKRLFYTQGDFGLFQCSKPCCQKTWDNEKAIREMVREQKEMRIPSERIPRCPNCGAPMTTNLRVDETFVQDEGWYQANDRYEDFVRRHKHQKVLYLELGVGMNTPGIIKFNFWAQVYQNPKARYICINKGQSYAPQEIRDRSICLDGDIGEVLDAISEMGGK